jgi:L-aminopeptidase/D-esterase-like protein
MRRTFPLLLLTATTLLADSPAPVPVTTIAGPALTFDFPGLRIGVAEYDEGPTGATIFHFSKPVMAAVDVRGGAPATINTDALRLSYDSPFVHAVAFAGGSSYGLAAATGVADEIKARTLNPTQWENVATVVGAIIFDVGGRRFSHVTPDYELGRAALRAAQPGRFPLGARGAGRFAMQAWYFGEPVYSGQGGAFRQLGPTRVAVFTVVNAMGSVVDRDGRVVRCAPRAGECGTIASRFAERVGSLQAPQRASGPGNTTITLLVTNQKLPLWALQRLAAQVHTSMARAIQPLATQDDGDTLFAVTTGEVDNPRLSPVDLGVVASEVAWDAVLASVPPLAPAGPETPINVPLGDLDRYTGTYEFVPGTRAVVARGPNGLTIQLDDHQSLYLPRNKAVGLVAVAPDEFLIEAERPGRLRFTRAANDAISGLTINPGHWGVAATRLR